MIFSPQLVSSTPQNSSLNNVQGLSNSHTLICIRPPVPHIYCYIDSSPFGLSVLISLLVQAIFFVYGLHILSSLCFLIGYIRLWAASWPKPFYDLDLRTTSKIKFNVLPVGDEDKSLHSKPNRYSFICIQRSVRQYHKWNIYLYKR